jgi:hypothetical protein
MDRTLIDRQRRFGERRMGVAGAREILGRTAELHEHASFRDEFARHRARRIF